MRIIVCVKQVPATNVVKMDPVTNTIIRQGVDSVINPFDSYAIEEALRIKEKLPAELVAISMGIPSVEGMLKKTIALGMDAAYLLSDRAFAGADTLATAYSLGQGIRKIGGGDLILCGKMATDGDTAQVGPALAEMLQIPHVTDVSKLLQISERALLVRKMTDDGYLDVEVQLPAVVTVVKEINVPRLPSISGILRGSQAQVQVWDAAAVGADTTRTGLSGSPTQVVKTFTPDLSVNCQWLEGNLTGQATGVLAVLTEQKMISN